MIPTYFTPELTKEILENIITFAEPILEQIKHDIYIFITEGQCSDILKELFITLVIVILLINLNNIWTYLNERFHIIQ